MELDPTLRWLTALSLLSSFAVPAAAQCGQWDPRLGVPGMTGPGNPYVYCSTLHDDGAGVKLYVGGGFQQAGGVTVNNVACWDGTSWSALGGGTDQPVLAIASHDDGQGAKLYIGGYFTMADGLPADHIASWDGTSWSEVGGGVNGNVLALRVGRAGSGGSPALHVGGSFTTAGSLTQVGNIVTWDGSGWQKLGTGVSGVVYALGFWDGPGAGPTSLYASGTFNSAGGGAATKIARWDGTSWSALGQGLSNQGLAIEPFDDGSGEKLYVGGTFNHAGGALIWNIATWDGSSWAEVGSDDFNGAVIALQVHDDGNGSHLYAGGQFSLVGSESVYRVARWDGSSWERVGAGFSQGNADVRTLLSFQDADGSALLAGGHWTLVDSLPSNKVAVWRGESIGVNYCTAKVTSGGCVPAMSSSGTPSLSTPSSFTITAGSLRPNSNGLIYFSLAGTQDVPFQDGHLCVKSPFYRLQVKNSGGSGSCSGVLTYTLADVLAHPGGGPLVVAGSRLDLQAWFRDPQAASATGLSDGLDLYVCP